MIDLDKYGLSQECDLPITQTVGHCYGELWRIHCRSFRILYVICCKVEGLLRHVSTEMSKGWCEPKPSFSLFLILINKKSQVDTTSR